MGLGLALALRLTLLSAISWIIHLTYPVFSAAGQDFSWRDLILIGGGLFLMVKTEEIGLCAILSPSIGPLWRPWPRFRP